jgi:hypothetical protein
MWSAQGNVCLHVDSSIAFSFPTSSQQSPKSRKGAPTFPSSAPFSAPLCFTQRTNYLLTLKTLHTLHPSLCSLLSKMSMEGSKMATRVQKQTAWAPWIKNLPEMLKPHFVEIKHQGESKFWHPDSQPVESFSLPCHTENTGRLPPLLDTGSKPAWETFGRPNSWAPSVTRYSPSYP